MIQNSIRIDEDQRLAVSVKQRNRQTFSKVYDKYAPALLGIINRIVNNEKLADEILQSTFVKAWNQVAGFNASGISLFTWLINLARQTAFEAIKQAQVKTLQYSTPVYEGEERGVEDNAPGNGQDQSSAFDLLYYMGLSCREAAAELNITVEELRSIVRRKIKKMQ